MVLGRRGGVDRWRQRKDPMAGRDPAADPLIVGQSVFIHAIARGFNAISGSGSGAAKRVFEFSFTPLVDARGLSLHVIGTMIAWPGNPIPVGRPVLLGLSTL